MSMIGRFVSGNMMAVVLGLSPAMAAAQVTFTINEQAPFAAVPKTAAEFEAFQDVQQETDPEDRLSLADEFLEDYENSEFRHLVMRFRFDVLYDQGDWDATVEAIHEGLAAEEVFREGKLALLEEPESLEDWPVFELDGANQRMIYYQSLADGYEALGDLDSALTYAEMTLDAQEEAWNLYASQNDPSTPEFQQALERQNGGKEFVLRSIYSIHSARASVPDILESAKAVLEVAPGDVEMLMRVSQIMSSQVPEDPAARASHLEDAEVYAEDAITALEEWAAGDASSGLSQVQKDGFLAEAYSNLGMIHFQTGDYAGAADAFGGAARLAPGEAMYHYQLGVAHNNSQNIEAAVGALARAVYLGFDQGRPALESVYQAMHNGSLDGLDDFVATEGAELP